MNFEFIQQKRIYMEKSEEFEVIKGKEYAIAKFLFLIAAIIFIVPLFLIFIFRGIYKLF